MATHISKVSFCLAAALTSALAAGHARAHDIWATVTTAAPAPANPAAPPAPGVTGQGKYKFRVFTTSSVLPDKAKTVLEKAHGGFAVDHRKGKGETYWSLPGAGILRVSASMKEVQLLATAPQMAETTMHNATIWYDRGNPFLVFPGVEVQRVFTTSLSGKLVHTLEAPRGDEFALPVVNDYFRGAGHFVPTDVEYLQGVYYIATGYSRLDYVLTARVVGTQPFKAEWHDLAFGGKGTGPGQLETGHGITIAPGSKRIDVVDRPRAEIDWFTRHGQYIGSLPTPMGSLPCDIDYLDEFALVPALDGPNKQKGAPIYLYENGKLVSTLMAKEDLGLQNFLHIHNAVLRKVDGRLYVLAQAWNPGDFAVLEQVKE